MKAPLTDSVPAEDISAAVAKSGLTISDICRNLNWLDSRGRAETSRLQRRLGRMEHATTHNGKVYRSKQRYISYELAVKIVEAAGVDPIDAGL